MTTEERNVTVYQMACNYLEGIVPSEVGLDGLEEYYLGDKGDFATLVDVFERIIESAQNYQRMPNVIKFQERRGRIREILFDYDFDRIIAADPEAIYQAFREAFDVKSKEGPHNSWRKWTGSVIDAAQFVRDFKNVDDFKAFVALFDYNALTRMALPLLISTKIRGIGFALACDCLKELGYLSYPKPDVHMADVFCRLNLSKNDPISVFEAIVRMSDDCRSLDPSATPYKIDKMIWLICSGRFYKHGITIESHKKEFIGVVEERMGERTP